MKKFLIILLLFVFNTSVTKADIASGFEDNTNFTNKEDQFNLWLRDNDHKQYLNFEPRKICKDEAKGSNVWYLNKCNEFEGSNNLKIKFYKDRWQVRPNAEPSRDTLIYYLWKTINHPYTGQFHTYDIEPVSYTHLTLPTILLV
mgnify:CR=1 FL=1